MKTLKMNRLLLVLLLGFVYSACMAQSDFTKKYDKTFTVKDNTVFTLYNKNGKVHIENHDANTVIVDVLVTVKNKDKSNAERIMDRIKINFNESGNDIKAETEITSSKKNGSFSKNDKGNFSIDYNVKMPETLILNLYNKYGEIFINKLKSKSNITCKYGSYQINELMTGDKNKRSNVDIKYSNGSINKCDYINLDIKYSGIKIPESNVLNINSGYSKLRLGKTDIIDVVSKYDPTFTVEEVTKFTVEGKYSGYDIEVLKEYLSAEVKYSNIEVANVEKDFSEIFVDSKYGSIKLGIESGASYKFHGSSHYGSLSYPGKKHKSEHGQNSSGSDFIGNNQSSKSKVTVKVNYGSIKVD